MGIMHNARRLVLLAALAAAIFSASAASAFGQGVPVEPGNTAAGAFLPAGSCGCHSMLVEEWSASMHSKALSDPIYNAKVDEADKATGGAIVPFCRKCHAPAAMMTGELEEGAATSPAGQEGVGCHFCHQITGMAQGEPGNTSQLVTPDGTRRAQIEDPQAPHPAAYSALHETSEICGGCHNVNHPVNGMHLESTFREWAESPYAAEGVTCQDCHMSEKVGVLGPSTGQAAAGAPTRDNIYHMRFVGGQVALGDAEAATALLKSAAEVKVEAPDVIAAGQEASITVHITNKGAGHYLPTGLTEVRQMWLEVTAENADGSATTLGERRFVTILKDDAGNAPVELWEATGIESDDRIPPRETVTSSFAMTMPQGTEKATIRAALYYKSVPDELAEKAGAENPTTEMAAASQAVFASEEAMAANQPAEGGEPQAPSPILIAFIAAGVVAIVFGVWSTMRDSDKGGV